MTGDSNARANFPHKLLLSDGQVLKLPKYFANKSSANTKLAKTELSTMVQSEGFMERLL